MSTTTSYLDGELCLETHLFQSPPRLARATILVNESHCGEYFFKGMPPRAFCPTILEP